MYVAVFEFERKIPSKYQLILISILYKLTRNKHTLEYETQNIIALKTGTRANDYLHDAQINIERIGDKTSQRRACIAMLPSLVGKRFINDLSKIEYEMRAQAILRPPPVFSVQFSMLRAVLSRKIY